MSGCSCSASTATRAVIREQHPQEGETHTVPTNEPFRRPLRRNLTSSLLQVEDGFISSYLWLHQLGSVSRLFSVVLLSSD